MFENIPTKGVIFSDFICNLAMSEEYLFYFIFNTKFSEDSDITKHWVKYYYSML